MRILGASRVNVTTTSRKAAAPREVTSATELMTDGSGLYLEGPALVTAAIGPEVSSEELGGA